MMVRRGLAGASQARTDRGIARSIWAAVAAIGLVSQAAALARPAPASAATLVPVTVTITRIVQPDDSIDPGITQGPWGDFYAGVTINGEAKQDNFPNRLDNGFEFGVGYIFPADFALDTTEWAFSRTADADAGNVPVEIEIWDNDDCDTPFCTDTGIFESNDDQADVKPAAGRGLSISVDPTTGRWTGDVAWPSNCAEGAESDHVKVCFEVSIDSTNGDGDGDGLLDSWERNGFNADGDGTIDVNLPAMGANPSHKDLFLELDYEGGQAPNGRADIQAMKAAFRTAPLPNPDGVDGVNLWVDTGALVDATAREGQASGTCNDGIDNGADGVSDGGDPDCVFLDASVEDPSGANCTDGNDNDGDGLADGADGDCLVGDNLGGGSVVPTVGACNFDATWYAAKRANFNGAARGWIFRYATSLALPGTCPSSGGWGEIGGNDFMDFNHDGGTIFHELGHTLNLRHGGDVNDNCKPNYVSAMNYDNQFGINRVNGGTILDYSPPRRALDGSSRGAAPLPQLKENDLDDGGVLDGADASNRFVFTNSGGGKTALGLNQPTNWNADVDPPAESNQTINLDTNATGGGPAGCANTAMNSTLNGFNDWTRVSLPFRQFGDSADGAMNPVTTPEPLLSELRVLRDDLNTTDLTVTLTDSADPVAAGTQLVYTATVTNNGPNPATSTRLVDTLPPHVTFVTASTGGTGSGGCSSTAGVVTCALGDVPANTSRSVSLTVDVPADLVYLNGAPLTISNAVTVSNLNGHESNGADNTDTEITRVVAVADVSITSTAITAPLDVLIGQPSSASIGVTVANSGPSSPIDVVLTSTATASAGVTVSPPSQTTALTALIDGTPRTIRPAVTLTCTTPGPKTVTIAFSVAPANAADTDPASTNNTATATFTIDCVVPIAINIRPGGTPNSINLNTDATLAALTTTAGEYGLPLGFDAATIDVSTVRLGLRTNLFNVVTASGATEIHGRVHLEDSFELDERTRDRDRDGVMHFKPSASGLTTSTTESCVTGRFTSGGNAYTFFGCDVVVVRP